MLSINTLRSFNLALLSRIVLCFTLLFFTAYSTAEDGGQQTMNTENSCNITAISQSQKYIRAILDDLSDSYTHVGGGGITKIELKATNTFEVSISQEERIDLITYELDMDDSCEVRIKNKSVNAIMPWEEQSQ
jgi:hypothetical protein